FQFGQQRRELARPFGSFSAIGGRQPIRAIAAESDAAHLSRRERIFGPLADLFSLMLGKCREQMDHQLVRMRVVCRDEIDAALHQPRDEMHVSRQSIELRNNQGRLGLLGRTNGSQSTTSSCRGSMPRFGSVAIHPWRLLDSASSNLKKQG